jgi:hypothetical protein
MRNALWAAGGALGLWLGLCVAAAIDIMRDAKVDWEANGGGCTADCRCKCQQLSCGCHIKPPSQRPKAPTIGTTAYKGKA